MKRSLGVDNDGSDGSRRNWTSTRRSFFKRKKAGRSSSRDPNSSASKELVSCLSGAVVLNLLLPCGTLDKLYQYLAAPLDAKIGLKVNKFDKWRHP